MRTIGNLSVFLDVAFSEVHKENRESKGPKTLAEIVTAGSSFQLTGEWLWGGLTLYENTV